MSLEQRFDELADMMVIDRDADPDRIKRLAGRRQRKRRTLGIVTTAAVLLIGGTATAAWVNTSNNKTTVSAAGPDAVTTTPEAVPVGGHAYDLCKAIAGADDRVAAAYSTNVKDAYDALPTIGLAVVPPTSAPAGPEPLAGRADDEFVASCFLAGPPNVELLHIPGGEPGEGLSYGIVTIDGQTLPIGFAPFPQNLEAAPWSWSAATRGTLRGQVSGSGGPAAATPTPLPNAVVTARRIDNPEIVVGLDTDTNGSFAIQLEPATYELEASLPQIGSLIHCTTTTPVVTIAQDQTVAVSFTCPIR
jgi:hypothetical protein